MNLSYKNQIKILVALFIVIHIIFFFHYGIRNLMDSSGYIEAADYFINRGSLMDIHHIFYIIPILLLSFFRFIFPGEVIPFLIFQCCISGLSVIALYKFNEKLFKNQWAGFFAALIFIFWIDNRQWNITLMTESLACSMVCLIMLVLINMRGAYKDFALLALLCVISFFIRPTGIISIVGILFFLLHYYWKVIPNWYLKTFLISFFVLISFTGAYLMFLHWDFTEQYKRGNIVTYIDSTVGKPLYSEDLHVKPDTVVFADDRETPIYKMMFFIINNPLYFLKTASLKILYLLTFVRPYYSFSHNLYLGVWLTFIYLLSWLGFRKVDLSPSVTFILAIVIINCLLIGMSTVDWDNRFYIPMEPGIVSLAGGGMYFVAKKVSSSWNKTFRMKS